MYVCIYIYICQDGGAVGFVDFTKLLFALSSLAQPLKRVRSIPEHSTRLEVVFVTISSFTKRTKVAQKVFQEG